MPSKQNNPYQKNISFNKQMTNIMRIFITGYRQGKNVAVYPAQFLHLGRRNHELAKKPFSGERNVD